MPDRLAILVALRFLLCCIELLNQPAALAGSQSGSGSRNQEAAKKRSTKSKGTTQAGRILVWVRRVMAEGHLCRLEPRVHVGEREHKLLFILRCLPAADMQNLYGPRLPRCPLAGLDEVSRMGYRCRYCPSHCRRYSRSSDPSAQAKKRSDDAKRESLVDGTRGIDGGGLCSRGILFNC